MSLLRLFAPVFTLLVVIAAPLAAQAPATPEDPLADLRALVAEVQTRLQAGATTADALATEIGKFDALIAAARKDDPEKAALVLMTKISLYVQVFQDADTARGFITQLATEFPDTDAGRDALRVSQQLDEQDAAATAQSAMIGKPAPALTFTWSNREGGLASLDALKGKVVVLDFWATWCGPCLSSFPQVGELVTHYAGSQVEVVGVTSLQGRVAHRKRAPVKCPGDIQREQQETLLFMEEMGMTWTVAITKEDVFNKEFGVLGIPSLAVLDQDGQVVRAGLSASD